jgi:hypothetical protein
LHMVWLPDPNGLPPKGRRAPDGAARGACCFLRRHDPFQVRRVEWSSAPQSQPSAEDTPTGKAGRNAGRKVTQAKLYPATACS